MKSLIIVFSLIITCSGSQKSYESYKVYNIQIASEEQSNILFELTNNDQYDLWTRLPRIGFTDVMVTPNVQSDFESFLKINGISYTTKIKNVKSVLQNELLRQLLAPKASQGKITFTKYHRYSEILDYVKQLTVTHSNITSLEVIGKTTEGRDLVVLKISTGGNNKPAILIDGGIHAREWISPAVVLYIMQELVENPINHNLMKNVDWHIIPNINPDGYEYTHTKDRMWRKTRSKGKTCYGTDPNRNFDFHWGGPGTSSNECSEIYRGPTAFSEPETRALRDYVLKNSKKFQLYLTFHSYGSYILHPWGYTSTPIESEKEQKALGYKVRDAIEKYSGTKYSVGGVVELLSAGAGGSDDWMKAVGGANLTYCVELPAGKRSNGFDMPPSRILSVAKEMFEGVKAFHSYFDNL